MPNKIWPIEKLAKSGWIDGARDAARLAIEALKRIEDTKCYESSEGVMCDLCDIARDTLNMKESSEHWVCPPCGETLTPTKARNHVCPEE